LLNDADFRAFFSAAVHAAIAAKKRWRDDDLRAMRQRF
jgi:hypothetical protein